MARPVQQGNRPKNVKNTLRRLLHFLRPHAMRMAVVIALVVVSAVGSVVGTYLLKPIFNIAADLFATGSADMRAFIGYIVALASIYLCTAGATYLYSRIVVTVSTRVLMEIRNGMFSHLQKLPLKYFDTHTHGEIMSRFTNDTDTLREMLSSALPNIISSVLTVLGVLTAMLLLSWRLTIVVLVGFVIMVLISSGIGKRSISYFRKRQAALAASNGFVEEMIEGQREVKVFVHEHKVSSDYRSIAENLRSASTQATSYAMILMPLMGNLNYFLYAATAVTGCILISGGLANIGVLAAFLQYTRQFSQPISQVSQQMNVILNALAGAERIFDLMDTPEEVDNGAVTLKKVGTDSWVWERKNDGGVEQIPLKGDVRFDHVTFSYDGEKTVMKDVSLYAKPGQKIALVGATGAGKTTVTNLINRFYDVGEGKITYDGIDVRDIKKDDLRRSLALVSQDVHLFTGTVMDNIRYGRLDATDEDVIAAARRANAHFFISHLPQGYQTVLTADGANLSQGQRQLISIARAAVADPPVLILDEATSSIDTRTEALIEKGMDELMRGRTVFVIAHRLSTIRNANAIMVMENGEIIERGDHDDLLMQKGKYYQLYMGMFELS